MKLIDSNGENWEINFQKTRNLNSISKITLNEKDFQLSNTNFSIKSNKIILSQGGQNIVAYVVKQKDTWWVKINGRTLTYTSGDIRKTNRKQLNDGSLLSPMPGTVLDVKVTKGQSVKIGDSLIIMEAMKMEHKITAPFNGTVEKLNCEISQKVDRGFVLIELKQN
ncbi:MAG: hypothetical protein CMB56_005150 [Methanobacteriota archaeon]|nr:MAG: hypothetical protein CMB56_005150 [Euryarchaeota archaeon]|tara:strand:- start:11161 stop:11658 length:498 start_codon:yes stop_codon:yes gene_type:complete